MFIIPMVGLSTRFSKAGYLFPKYMLPLWGSTVFTQVLNSFKDYFDSDFFLFICRSDNDAFNFVQENIKTLGISKYEIVQLSQNTRGQAETVYEGIKNYSEDTELFIFNIDTIRSNFRKSRLCEASDGYLEVFEAEGENWSFVLGHDSIVFRTSEKERISGLCSDGLYFFKSKRDFDDAFKFALENKKFVNGELYIAPLYNHLIENSRRICYEIIPHSDVILCGTPLEYEQLIRKDC